MTLRNPQTCLSAELLRQLSRDELSPAELKDVEDHVGDCERCRQLLEVPQSDPQWQDEIVPILRSPLESPHVAVDHEDRGSEGESLESILRLLGPTDDPHMLGRIGSYEVVGVIGRGGMGVVFKAYEGALNRFVAIKMLLPHLATSGAARKRFAREGKAAAAVIDDNVMPIYSVAEWQGVPYLVTQYSRGSTLQKRIQDQGPLDLKEILRIGMQTARGLAAAHAQGLVHRDVKPSNILLDGTVERALLTDFGLARAVDDASITRTGVIAGTPQYMSPEQARGGSVDARSDLFGLGCVLYAMCTGRPPFRADSSYAILRMITDDDPRSIREINPDIPEWLSLLISRLMAKSPDARFGNALEVAALLEQCLAHVQQPTSVPLPASLVPHATGRRSILKRSEDAMKTNLYTDRNGVRQLHWLRIILFSAIAPGSVALIAIACGVTWSDGALWMMAWLSWAAFAGGLVRATTSVPLEQQTATASDCRPTTHADGRRSIFNGTRKGVIAMLGTIGTTLLGMVLWQATEAPDISGQWTSEEWGTVVLEQKQPGQYQGTMTDSLLEVDPYPIQTGKTGKIELKWSRSERRFNGTFHQTWNQPANLSGKLSLRLVDNEILGAWTTDKDAQKQFGTPRLADLLWTRSSNNTAKDADPSAGNSLAAAAKRFNSETAEVRSKLFAPPIPDLTAARLREGFRQAAHDYRRQGKQQVADALEKIAESGRLPNEASHLIGSGVHSQDEDGGTISRQVVPALVLPDDTTSTGNSLVVLRPLELIYRKDGPVSKDYGDQFHQEQDRLDGVWEAVLSPDIAARQPEEQRLRLVFDGNWHAAFRGSERLWASRLKLEPQQTPKRISFVEVEQGRTRRIDDVKGIYEVEKDGLRLSMTPDTEALPTQIGAEHSEFKRVTGKLADEQLAALKQYSKTTGISDPNDPAGDTTQFDKSTLPKGSKDLRPGTTVLNGLASGGGIMPEAGNRPAPADPELGEESPQPESPELFSAFELRLAWFEPDSDRTEHTVPGTRQKIYLASQPFVSIADVAAARAIDDASGQPAIEITFLPDSAKRIEVITQQHLNQPVAILVDGKLLTAPTIRDQFGRASVITGIFSREEAERIAQKIEAAKAVFGQSVSDIDAGPVWGKAVDGLQLGVSGIRQDRHFKSGDTIRFRLSVRNVGTEVIRFEYRPPKMCDWTAPHVEKATGEAVQIQTKAFRGGHNRYAETLEPNAEASIHVSGILVLGASDTAHKWWPHIENPEPGKYTLRAGHLVQPLDAAGTQIAKPSVLTSGTIAFQVD